MSLNKLTYTKYTDVVNFWKKSSDKIKMVCFAQEDCPFCDDFLPDILLVALKEFKDHFEWVFVDIDEATEMPFPVVNTPTAYFHVPNTKEKMPLVRVGGTTPQILKNDLEAMIDIKDNEKTLVQAFLEDRQPEISQWGQQFLN
jgi:thiol-disulfide isomerase/thioredoxin